MENKICPLFVSAIVSNPNRDVDTIGGADCLKEKCMWWTGAIHIQNHPEARGAMEYNCALVILAMKNSEGTVYV